MDDLEAKPLIGERRVERDDGVFEIKPGRPRIIQGWRLRSYALVSNSTHSSAPTYSSGASLDIRTGMRQVPCFLPQTATTVSGRCTLDNIRRC
jgi:hypothetical protein